LAAPSHSEKEPAKVGLTASGRRRGDRDVRGSVDPWHRGKKTPTLAQRWANTHKARGQTHTTRHQNRVSWTIRRSVPGVVKTLGSPVKPVGSQNPGGAHAVKIAEVLPGACEVRVHAVSYGWQKSIGRIARLARWEIARSRGEETWQGASQKEARSTA